MNYHPYSAYCDLIVMLKGTVQLCALILVYGNLIVHVHEIIFRIYLLFEDIVTSLFTIVG